jgi:hypothetical protein
MVFSLIILVNFHQAFSAVRGLFQAVCQKNFFFFRINPIIALYLLIHQPEGVDEMN